MKNRVVVTGMGALTPVGNTLTDTWNALLAGTSGVGPLTRFDPSELPAKIAGQLKDFDPEVYIDRKEARKTDRFVHYAVAASTMAIKHSGLDLAGEDPDRIAVIYGSGIGGLETFSDQHQILLEKGARRVSPFFIPMLIIDMAAGYISMTFGLKGPNFGVVSACASGSHAIGEAFRCLQYGDADVVVTGGAESTITPVGMAGFCSARALSTRNDDPATASRPFDKDRDGFVMAEGAGTLVLETLEHAQKRGAVIYAELKGYGRSGDAYHMTAPAPGGEGGARGMKWAMRDAGLEPGDIDYINAHGTSTGLNDKFETMAIKAALGEERARQVPISSTKSMTGHMLGASGAVELIACIQTINTGIIHPTANYHTPDPECDLDYVPNTPRRQQVNTALSNSLGFGGHNVTLIVSRYTA